MSHDRPHPSPCFPANGAVGGCTPGRDAGAAGRDDGAAGRDSVAFGIVPEDGAGEH